MLRPLLVAFLVVTFGVPEGRAAELPHNLGLYASTGASLPLLDSKVEITVRGAIIEALVTQRFHNRSDRATEATYIFPLPVDAAVSAMSIKSGSRTIRAAIERRDEAQRRYEAAVRAGVSAALLDQERPDVFTQTVTAIPPKSTVEITLRFDMMARYRGGTWELVLPMVVAPRYVPGVATARPTTGMGRAPDTDRAPDASRVTPGGGPGAGGATDVTIQFVDKVTDVTSPTHEVKVAGHIAAFTDPKTDHDAVVRWKASVPATGWVEQAPDGSGYAAVLVEAAAPPARRAAVRCMLVLDRSASARGDAEAMAQPLVRQLLAALGPSDRVAVAGSDQIAWTAPADVARALDAEWTSTTGPFDLTRALATARPDGAPIILITGGLVADDRAAISAARKVRVPIHVIGVGPAPARGLLTQIAVATGGTARFAVPGDDIRAMASATLADVGSPPAPLAVSWGTLAASDVVPGVLPRLGTGQAMLVLARVRRPQTANARASGELFAIEMLPAPRGVDGATTAMGPIARRWARSRLDEMLAGAANAAGVTALALQFGLVSPYTSMVAIGDEVIVQGGTKRSVAIPVSVPAGMKWQQVKKEITVDTTGGAAGVEQSRTYAQPGGGAKAPVAKVPPRAPEPEPESGLDKLDEPDRAKAKKPARDEEEAETKDSRAGEDESEEPLDGELQRNLPAPTSIAVTGTTSGEALPEDVLEQRSSTLGRSLRLAMSLGGGFARSRNENSGLISVGARLEAGGLTMLGLDTSLWFLAGDVQGRVLLSVSRLGINRWLELGAGLGIHAGDGVGPAGSLGLRFHLPPAPAASGYLRFDGALLLDDQERRGQQTFTLGLEYGF